MGDVAGVDPWDFFLRRTKQYGKLKNDTCTYTHIIRLHNYTTSTLCKYSGQNIQNILTNKLVAGTT
jgi:hypothetical protein